MGRPDGRIEKGQRLNTAISARAWNRAQDAADHVLGVRPGFEADGIRGPSAPYTTVLCKALAAVNRWGVLEITGIEISPTGPTGPTGTTGPIGISATRQFESMPVLQGSTPSANATAIAIALEPIAAGAIGRVAVDGAVQVKMEVGSVGHRYARAKASSLELQSASDGPVVVLWKDTSTGPSGPTGPDRWSLVRLGGGGGSGAAKLCKTTSNWAKNTLADLDVWDGTPGSETKSSEIIYGAVNKFGFVFADKFVLVAPVDGLGYYLVAAEC